MQIRNQSLRPGSRAPLQPGSLPGEMRRLAYELPFRYSPVKNCASRRENCRGALASSYLKLLYSGLAITMWQVRGKNNDKQELFA